MIANTEDEFLKRRGSLDFLDTSADNVTEDMVLDYLAEIIVDIYFSGEEISKPLEDDELTIFLRATFKNFSE